MKLVLIFLAIVGAAVAAPIAGSFNVATTGLSGGVEEIITLQQTTGSTTQTFTVTVTANFGVRLLPDLVLHTRCDSV
jgi:hypothetical protein